MTIAPKIDNRCPWCGHENKMHLENVFCYPDDGDLTGAEGTWTNCDNCNSRYKVEDKVIIKGLANLLDEVISKISSKE